MTTETLENEFIEALTMIASGLNIAAERIFGIFVSAQVVIGVLEIVSTLLILSGAYLVGVHTRKWCVKAWRNGAGEWRRCDYEEAAIWFPWVAAVCAAGATHITASVVSSAILKICCPEYAAVREIIGLVIP